MIQILKKIIKKTPLYPAVIRHWIDNKKIAEWKKHGCPVPPPHVVKQQTIKDYAKKFNLKILVETGTYYGDMVEAMKPYFNQIYSIELGKDLYENAKKRFDGDKRIKIIHGDSGIELGNLVINIQQPALFWLDGHYSEGVTARGEKDTPILEELTHIFNSQQSGHVVVIDDARCFGTYPSYPSIQELNDFIKSKSPHAKIEIKNDSIRIIPHRKIG